MVLGVVFGFIYWNEGSQLGSNISGFIVGGYYGYPVIVSYHSCYGPMLLLKLPPVMMTIAKTATPMHAAGIVIIVIGLSLLLLKPRARPLEDVTVALAGQYNRRRRNARP